jgi:two-component system phosphate regulon response regulator PhoB
MQFKILVVDDSVEHQQLVLSLLSKQHLITQAFTLAETKKFIEKNHFDLILLEISLPDGDGLTFYADLQMVEKTRDIPVIFITSHTEINKEVMGFSLGAEDFIIKPLEPARFKARMESRIKQLQLKKEKELMICKGNLRLSVPLQKASILLDGVEQQIELTPVEFKLLFQFLRNEDYILTREQLLTAVWGTASDVLDRTIDMHVSNLRKKIGQSVYKIKAVHGSGYKLMQIQVA